MEITTNCYRATKAFSVCCGGGEASSLYVCGLELTEDGFELIFLPQSHEVSGLRVNITTPSFKAALVTW